MKKGLKIAVRLLSFATLTLAVFLTGFIGKLTQGGHSKNEDQNKLGSEGLFSVVNIPTALADVYGAGCGGYGCGAGCGGCGTSDGGGTCSAGGASCGGGSCSSDGSGGCGGGGSGGC